MPSKHRTNYRHELNLQRRENGLCVSCGRDSGGNRRCKLCSDKESERTKLRLNRRTN